MVNRYQTGRIYWVSLLVLTVFTFENVLSTALDWLPQALAGVTSGQTEQAPSELDQAAQTAFADPLLTPELLEHFPLSLHIGPTDPVLDQDPFFLRSQSWSADSVPTGDATYYESTADGVRVGLPGTNKTWNLRAPLDPLMATDDFLFFTARDPKLLADKTPGSSDADEDGLDDGGGVFIVATQDLASAFGRSAPVPVFFMPLAGDAWDIDVRAYEDPQLSAIHFVDGGDEVATIKTKDIANIVAAERKNLEAAQTQSAIYRIFELRRNAGFMQKLKALAPRSQELILKLVEKTNGSDAPSLTETKELGEIFSEIAQAAQGNGDDFIYPGRGATAGFGVLYTGYDLDRSNSSPLVAQNKSFLESFAKWISPKSAYADDDDDDPAKLMRSAYASAHTAVTILAYLFIFSVVTRVAVPSVRQRLREVSDARDQREMEQALQKAHEKATKIARKRAKKTGEPFVEPTLEEVNKLAKIRDYDGIWHRYFRRQRRAIFNNFTYALTALKQFETQTTHAVVGTFMDRYMTRFAAAPNKLLRRIFEGTIVHRAKISSSLPVNDQLLGQALVIAGIDTGLYAWQLYDMVPGLDRAIGLTLSPLFPGAPHFIEHSLQNPHIDVLRNYEILKSGQDGVVGGPLGLVSSSRDFYTQTYLGRVRMQMIREGLDPFDSRNAVEFRRRLDEVVDHEMRLLGVPGKDEKGWDLVTIYGSVKRFLGYDAPKGMRTVEDSEGNNVERLLFGKQRPGLVYPALQASLDYEEDLQKNGSMSLEDREAQEFFRSMQKDYSILRSMVRGAFKAATFQRDFIQDGALRFQRVRQSLVLLTAAGDDVRPLLEVLQMWKGKISEAAALRAARIYSSKFIELMTGKKVRLLPTAAENAKFGTEAEQMALVDLQVIFGEEHADLAVLRAQHGMVLQQLKEQHVMEAVKAAEKLEQAKAEKYQYEKLGWFGRWQKARVYRRAQNKFIQKFGTGFSADLLEGLPSEHQKKWRQEWHRAYAEEYARGVGLYPDFNANPSLQENVFNKTDFVTIAETNTDTPLGRELQGLLGAGRFDQYENLRAEQYAKNFIRVYEDKVENVGPEEVPAKDPSRPGRYQKFRQRKGVRHDNPFSKTLTTCVRVLEATSYPTHKLGMNALLDRELPGYYDFKLSIMSELRALPIKAGPEYWMLNKFWNNPITRKFWVLGRLTLSWTYRMGGQMNMRGFRNVGLPLMGRMRHVVLGATFYAFATFWGSVIQQPITDWWDESAWNKISGWWNTATWPARWGAGMVKCHVLGRSCDDDSPDSKQRTPETDAEKVHDVVQDPQEGSGSSLDGGMGRMWDDEGGIDAGLNWAPAN